MTATQLVTVEELYQMGSNAPYELIEGLLKEVSPSSVKSDVFSGRIASVICSYVDAHEPGYVSGSSG